MKKIKRATAKKAIIFCGGGTGGHITPLGAVASELKKLKAARDYRLIFVGQKGDQLISLLPEGTFDKQLLVHAGKWRRYSNLGWRQYLDLKTLLLNIRDLFRVVIGYFESRMLLRRQNAKLVFIKGGYVGLPLGLAAARAKIPIITHDSDTHPGLANRLLARWVIAHLVAHSAKLYPYPPEDTITVGIPVRHEFKVVQKANIDELKQKHSLTSSRPILLVIGGSQGAGKLNKAIEAGLEQLTRKFQIVHIAGQSDYQRLKKRGNKYYQVHDIVRRGIEELMVISDAIISRASATTIAEATFLGRPLILIPGKQLANDHQTLNAKHLTQAGAALMLDEDELLSAPGLLVKTVKGLLSDEAALEAMDEAQQRLSKPDSASAIAKLLVEHLKG